MLADTKIKSKNNNIHHRKKYTRARDGISVTKDRIC
jgi:hypothetical protein